MTAPGWTFEGAIAIHRSAAAHQVAAPEPDDAEDERDHENAETRRRKGRPIIAAEAHRGLTAAERERFDRYVAEKRARAVAERWVPEWRSWMHDSDPVISWYALGWGAWWVEETVLSSHNGTRLVKSHFRRAA